MTASHIAVRVGGVAVALGLGLTVACVGTSAAQAAPADSLQTSTAEADTAQVGTPVGSGAPSPRSPGARSSTGSASASGGLRGRRNADARPAPDPKGGNKDRKIAPGPLADTGPKGSAVAPADPASGAREEISAAVASPQRPEPTAAVIAVAAAPKQVAASPVAQVAAGPAAAAPSVAAAQPQVPVMTVPRKATATAVQSVLSPLLRTGSGGLVDSPVSWAVFAAARRQPGQAADAVTPVASVVTTGQVVPVAAETVMPAAAAVTNKPPVISAVNLSTPNASSGAVTGTVKASDPEGRKLTYKATTSKKGAVSITTAGVFTYTPTATARHAAARTGAATSAKTDTVTVVVTDASGASASRAVTVTISPKNTAPVAGTTTVGTPDPSTGVVTGKVNATDADKDTLSYSAPATTGKGAVSVNAGTGAFTYTPSDTARTTVTGTDSFTVAVLDGYGGSTPVSVSVPVAPKAVTPAKISVVFNYGSGSSYWTPEAKSALQASADALANYIVVSKPVTLVFDVTAESSPESSTLASAGSDLVSGRAGFANTVVQNKILKGVDSNGKAADGTIEVNFGNPWAYGDSVSSEQYDFKSTMMHEMMHAYGFLAYVDEAGYNTGTRWTIFDSFIATRAGTKVINTRTYRFGSGFSTNLTGGDGGLFFIGPNAVAAYGGPVPLYTPKPWEAGSSVSHLDDNTFTGTTFKLMNALSDTGLGARTLSPVELGILSDLGYTVRSPSAAGLLLFGVVFLRRKPRRSGATTR